MELSKADQFNTLPYEERQKALALVSDDAAEALVYDWDFWARPSQRSPLGDDWVGWLVLAGRGFGKTRIGAEQTRVWAKNDPIVNLVGPTAGDVRDVMIEGPSGIMQVCPNGERPLYQPSKARLVWPNGAVSLLFSAEEPERLRGPQAYKAWADEVAAWQYIEDSWDMLMFGLRLGESPQWCITTTPKPVKLLKQLIKDPTVRVTRGSTYDNRANLAAAFYNSVVVKYEGTRLGRQELNAELLEDNPGALWQRKMFDDTRIANKADVPPLVRIVIPIDPAVTSSEDSADTGIVPVGRDNQVPCHFYVLEDATCHLSPDGWAQRAVQLFYRHRADRVIGEVNNGGDMVEATLRHADPNIPYTSVHATRGKLVRAEPIAALYEQGRVHHVGSLGALEDQMCDYVPGVSESPDRMDSLVWGMTELSGIEEHEIEIVVGEDEHISSDLDEFDFAEMRV